MTSDLEVKENAKTLWDDPRELIEAWKSMPSKDPREERIVELSDDGDYIVDLGCGNGRLLHCFDIHRYDFKYIGYDNSLPMILHAKSEHKLNKESFAVVDILSFQSGEYYDIAICQDVAQHYHKPMEFISRLISNWQANKYVFSFLVGDEREELYNSTVVSLYEYISFIEENRQIFVSDTYMEKFDDTKFAWFLISMKPVSAHHTARIYKEG